VKLGLSFVRCMVWLCLASICLLLCPALLFIVHLAWLVAWLSCLPCRIWCKIIIIMKPPKLVKRRTAAFAWKCPSHTGAPPKRQPHTHTRTHLPIADAGVVQAACDQEVRVLHALPHVVHRGVRLHVVVELLLEASWAVQYDSPSLGEGGGRHMSVLLLGWLSGASWVTDTTQSLKPHASCRPADNGKKVGMLTYPPCAHSLIQGTISPLTPLGCPTPPCMTCRRAGQPWFVILKIQAMQQHAAQPRVPVMFCCLLLAP
jgi:hypothetical protein